MRTIKSIASLILTICITSNFLFSQTKGTFTDERDKQVYKTVKIGDQTWMAQNLNFASSTGSWCYDDISARCEVFGRLYDWETSKNVCPANWHLPSDKEWTVLADFLGGEDLAGGKMKDTIDDRWMTPNLGATNSSGFNGIPGGFRVPQGQYGDTELTFGMYGNWWSSTEFDAENALRRRLAFKFEKLANTDGNKKNGYSVRCVKD
ncbi:MAG: fibrobacter succinogenes major paralogous domain-containing protein [Bacteroidota bacterium]